MKLNTCIDHEAKLEHEILGVGEGLYLRARVNIKSFQICNKAC